MAATAPASAFSRITALASLRQVHQAFHWLHIQQQRILDWQAQLVAVAAPPFQERLRAEWLCERFRELDLECVEIDPAGNALALLPSPAAGDSSPVVLLSAHIDTVFPAAPIQPTRDGNLLSAPGACDNGAGVSGLLAIAAALKSLDPAYRPARGILFAGNVGEEGEGDLRGIRHLYRQSPWASRIAANLVLDGAGHEVAVNQALGSRRFRVTVRAPGGHSWIDSTLPNPIVLISRIIARLSEFKLPDRPRSTLSIGTISGGTSVNSIPERASATFDLRSTDPGQLIRLEVELHRVIEDTILDVNRSSATTGNGVSASSARGPKKTVSYTVEKIGDRPAASLPEDAQILALLRAVDRHLDLRTELRTASTDANIPLALGIEALSLGAGGEGGGIHTQAEWYDATNRELGLRRILLLLLALAGSPSPLAAPLE